ncbi:MAG: hypothetical protein ABIR92_08475 [Gemmatimonadaceae bacterium]
MSRGKKERRAIANVDRRVRRTNPLDDSPWVAPDVIIVDDDDALCELISFAIESTGRAVTAYHDGATALTELARLPETGDRRLLLLSVDLGGIDGHSVHEKWNEIRPGAFMVAFMSFGYRQITLWFRLQAFWRYVAGETRWGSAEREGFQASNP